MAPEAVDGDRTFARYNGSNVSFTNCFEVNGSQVTQTEETNVGSGKLCYDINEGAGKVVFYQTLGSDMHPVLDPTHGIVGMEDGKYVNITDGIEKMQTNTTEEVAIYSINGMRQQQLSHGVNIVRHSNGKVTKVFVK